MSRCKNTTVDCMPLHTIVCHCIPLHSFVAYRCMQSYISISTYKNINIYKYSNIRMCLYKQSLMYPLQWKMTPPVENDRDPLRGNLDPHQWK